jgi:hypothetical protein
MIACATTLLLFIGSAAQATTLYVNCGAKAGLSSVGLAIKAVQGSESRSPATIYVSGACHENIVIQGLDRLSINALNGASITDASNGAQAVIAVVDSHSFSLTGFTINGTGGDADGFDCLGGSECRLVQDIFQGAGGSGIFIVALSKANIVGSVTQNNGFAGLGVGAGATVLAQGIASRGNFQGVYMQQGANVVLQQASTITGNQAEGIFARTNATLTCNSCVITTNGAAGINLLFGSAAQIGGGTSISGNVGAGVSVSDGSKAIFAGGSGVTGNNGSFDVACNPQYPVTRGVASTGGSTNCIEP